MSIVLLKAFTINSNNKVEIENDYSFAVYLGIFSLIIFSVYSYLYKTVIYFHRDPNGIMYLKILSVAFTTAHFLLLIMTLTHQGKYQEFLINFSAIISVPIIYSNNYFNSCIAHNIYETFYSYNKSFEKRKQKYLLCGILSILIVTFFSIEFRISYTETNSKQIHFTFEMFNKAFTFNIHIHIYTTLIK